jgi:hypothetical protein
VLEEVLNLMMCELKAGHFNQIFLFACRNILDFDCILHKHNFQIAEETLQALYTKGSGQAWRKDMKEGDMIDSLLHYYDKGGSSRGSGWTKAKIGKIEGDTVQLEYPMEPREADRTLERWSAELAQPDTKSKEPWEWKSTLKVDDQIDAMDDTFKWLKATIISIEEVDDQGRAFPMATVGMRVYVASGVRSDDRGPFDGWGERFDEKISVYSPRLCQFLSRSTKTAFSKDDEEVDESLDEVMKPEAGFSRLWAVPRPRKCTSSEYLRLLNTMCEKGMLDTILKVIEETEMTDDPIGFNLCVLAIFLSLLALPAKVYHRDVMKDYALRIVESS